MRDHTTTLAGTVLIALVIVACAVLVGLDKLDGDLFMGVVIGPVVGGVVGVVGSAQGARSGSQATIDPPPSA
jgi:hypothetical protein